MRPLKIYIRSVHAPSADASAYSAFHNADNQSSLSYRFPIKIQLYSIKHLVIYHTLLIQLFSPLPPPLSYRQNYIQKSRPRLYNETDPFDCHERDIFGNSPDRMPLKMIFRNLCCHCPPQSRSQYPIGATPACTVRASKRCLYEGCSWPFILNRQIVFRFPSCVVLHNAPSNKCKSFS